MGDPSIPSQAYYPGVLLMRLVDVFFGIVEVLLVFRVVLKFFGGSASSEFVAWIYTATNLLLGPFAGAFQSIPVQGFSVVDVVAILAIIAYAILGWIVIKLLSFVFSTATKV